MERLAEDLARARSKRKEAETAENLLLVAIAMTDNSRSHRERLSEARAKVVRALSKASSKRRY